MKESTVKVRVMFHVPGQIYYLMEQRKVSVEELDSVPLDQVWVAESIVFNNVNVSVLCQCYVVGVLINCTLMCNVYVTGYNLWACVNAALTVTVGWETVETWRWWDMTAEALKVSWNTCSNTLLKNSLVWTSRRSHIRPSGERRPSRHSCVLIPHGCVILEMVLGF